MSPVAQIAGTALTLVDDDALHVAAAKSTKHLRKYPASALGSHFLPFEPGGNNKPIVHALGLPGAVYAGAAKRSTKPDACRNGIDLGASVGHAGVTDKRYPGTFVEVAHSVRRRRGPIGLHRNLSNDFGRPRFSE